MAELSGLGFLHYPDTGQDSYQLVSASLYFALVGK